jgi:ABC-type multidrug transport system fused ATPase/permease subunit
VTLSYPGRPAPALAGVSITICPGDRILLAGPSGAGKSSLLGLLLRFAEPTSGQITAGGIDLAAIPVSQWRQQLAWVPQRPYLFAGSVADNIALGAPGATASAIRAAAGLAGADDFIMALPFRYDTRLAEYGLTLSAGQRQRIALARAFLRDAPFVLLDEPTAHLDAVSAQQIMAAVESLAAGRTVLLASHRNHAVMGATGTLELRHGQLSADGPVGTALPAGTGDPAGVAIG